MAFYGAAVVGRNHRGIDTRPWANRTDLSGPPKPSDMFGLVTRRRDDLSRPEFDRTFFEVKGVTGRRSEPSGTINMISCFGDSKAADDDPSIVPVSANGTLATRESEYFDWSYICPTKRSYRSTILELVESCVEHADDLRIDDIGFPRAEYCHCSTCTDRFHESRYDDRRRWRAAIITGFVEEIADIVPGRLYATVYPNPYPNALYTRTGVDIDAVQELVDAFIVPIYDMAYSTTYWLEILAQAFRDRLDVSFGIELYAVDIDIDRLEKATRVADAYADDVYFAYDANVASSVIDAVTDE